ncbi:MAG: hypothetical protein ABWZ88_17120 [Variovorax sp.]
MGMHPPAADAAPQCVAMARSTTEGKDAAFMQDGIALRWTRRWQGPASAAHPADQRAPKAAASQVSEWTQARRPPLA